MATRNDPYGDFNFLVEIDGMTEAGFVSCTGMGVEVEVIEYREGGDAAPRKLPGLRKFSNITLKRGVTQSTALQDWMNNVANGQSDRRNGAVILLDDTREPALRWNFFNAFPVKWEGPCLHAKGNDVAIETLTLCCEGLVRS
jgi:phage tail-like protein